MTRFLCLVAVWSLTVNVGLADEPVPKPPLVEQYLHEGKFAQGETALLLALDANPDDDEARFGLGVIQVMRAVEGLGKSLYEYGAISENATQLFLRLPVPINDKPSAISYKEFGRVIGVFASDLQRAEVSLSQIKDENVKLRLRLAEITFDFAGNGMGRTTLIEILNKINRGRFDFQKTNPDFRIHFDRGDVAWLRAYCHALMALVEGYRAVDLEHAFNDYVRNVFPRIEASAEPPHFNPVKELRFADGPRLRRMRQHMVAVCELNRETWQHIRQETDDDYEWLPHPRQTDMLGLPFTDQRIDRWLKSMAMVEALLKGESVVHSDLVRLIAPNHKPGYGLNVKKLLDDPPQGIEHDRLATNGIDAKYLELETEKKLFDMNGVMALIALFSDPLAIAYGFRLN